MARTRRKLLLVVVGLVGFLVSGTLIFNAAAAARGKVVEGHGFVRVLDRPSRPLDILLGRGDGQAFAQFARDPALNRPGDWTLGASDAAYRAQRPLLGYVTWALSLGNSALVPVTLAILAAISGGAALAALGASSRRSPLVALLALLAPGFLVSVLWFTPELLGLALGAGSIVAYRRDRLGWCVLLLALAGLARESMLLVGAGLGLHALVVRRRLMVQLAIPVGVWAAWAVIAHLRFGEPILPLTAPGDMDPVPLRGLLWAAQSWSDPLDALTLAVTALSVVALVAVRPRTELTWVAATYGLLAFFLGGLIWAHWYNAARLLLPLHAFTIVAMFDRSGEHLAAYESPAGGASRLALARSRLDFSPTSSHQ